MANIPGTEGPVDYPNQPEGGEQDGPLSLTTFGPLPGGSNRFPQLAPDTVNAQQGAGSGSGGLYPGAQGSATAGDGTIQKGYRGDSYADDQAPGATQPPANQGSEFVTGGQNGSSVDALSVPTSFTKPSGDQG